MGEIGFADVSDIDSWMELVTLVRWNFPGLEMQEALDSYRATAIKNIARKSAICAKEGNRVVGVLLFLQNPQTLSCMAVHPDYRKQGIATGMINLMLSALPEGTDISVTTFRQDDEKGIAPRVLYKKFGFVEGELCHEHGYPLQKFILHRR
jgi:GNAT superfamily N-acetyltransferase